MATALYDTGRNAFATGDIDWVADTIKAILVDAADYTVNLATDEFLDDIAGAARVSTVELTNKSADAGVCDCDNPTFADVSGDQFEAVVIYKHTGVEGTSQLIAYIDNITELPITPNGGDILYTIDSGANKLFKL